MTTIRQGVLSLVREDLLKRVDFDNQSQRGRARELEELRTESKESARETSEDRWTSQVTS
jgi:hypothetical protein